MCGRFAITLPPEAVRAFFAYVEQPNFPPRYNIAPTQPIPIVSRARIPAGASGISCSRAGASCPASSRTPRNFPLLINARAETLAQKPSFRAALRRRRCLVIADGFYEWRREAPGAAKTAAKAPFLIRRVDRRPDRLRRPDGRPGATERRRDRHRLHRHDHGQSPDGARSRPHAGDPRARRLRALARHRRRRRGNRDRAAAPGARSARSNWCRSAPRSIGSPTTTPALQAPVGEAIRAAPPQQAR